jgi:hypothetical protein
VVRGAIADGANRNDMLRRARLRRGVPATLIAKPRRWLGLDVEKIACPTHIDLIFEPDLTVEHAISLLPIPLHDATAFWQLTGGHGLKPGIRLRLWYWLSRLASDEELRRWLGERVPQVGIAPDKWLQRWPIDPALYHPIQLHYTAMPTFHGLPDPVPLRCGWRLGFEDIVVIPDLALAQAQICRSSTSAGPAEPGLGYEGWRTRIGDQQGGDGFFKPIKSAIGSYFGVNGSGASAEWLTQDLAAVIRERRCDRSDGYIEERLRDLPNAIAAIRAMQASREEETTEQARQILHFESDNRGPLLIAARRDDAEAGRNATGLEAWGCPAGLPKTLGDGVSIDRMVVVLFADENRFSLVRRAVRKTIRQWQREGRKVVQAAPWPLLKGNGSTFADLLREAGPEAVKARIEAALTPRTLPERIPVEQARQLLCERIRMAVEQLVSWTPAA